MNFGPEELSALRSELGLMSKDEMQKALAATAGFVGRNLERPATLLMPFVAPVRSRLAVDTAAMGAPYVEWKVQVGFGMDFSTAFGVAEAGIGNAQTLAATVFKSLYSGNALNDSVTQEAVDQSKGYDDAMAISSIGLLSSIQRLDELMCIGGDYDGLATPTLCTSVAGGTGSYTSPTKYYVTALTLQGILANSNGKHTTPASTKCVGESAPMEITPSASSSNAYDLLTIPAVPGAWGYKIYAGANAGAAKLVPVSQMSYAADGKAVVANEGGCFIGLTKVRVIYDASTAITVIPPSTNGSANPLAFNGLKAWCEKQTAYGVDFSSSSVAGATAPNVIDCAGATLTGQGAGIAEFDQILAPTWRNWKSSPTLILTSPLGKSSVSDLLVAGGKYVMKSEIDDKGAFTGGLYIGAYLNKYASGQNPGLPATIPVWGHPEIPDGTFLFISEKIPYPTSRESVAFALDIQRPYSYFPLAPVDRRYPFSLFFAQTLKCRHPYAQASIVGARVV
jgi:hypothetical protein